MNPIFGVRILRPNISAFWALDGTGQERQTGWGSFTAATSAEAPTVPRTQKAASNAGAPTAVRQPSDSGTAATSAVGLSADAASLAPHQLQEQEETANVPSLMDLDGVQLPGRGLS